MNAAAAPGRYDDLAAVFVNCSLKPDPAESHTQLLLDRAAEMMRGAGVRVDTVHAVTADLAPGVQPDMTEHGFATDGWPAVQQRVLAADILIVGTPIWLGMHSSVCTRVIERLYSYSGELNEHGQSVYYGRVGGCLVTGNEDGIKHCAMSILYALQHLGYTVPPQADAGWIGEAGPGPSYGDVLSEGAVPVGYDNDFTNRNTTIMVWNLLHLARLLKDSRGLPAYGNDRRAWSRGDRFGWSENPEYR